MSMRRYDLDWIRVIIILNLVPFHLVGLMLYVPEFSNVSSTSVIATLMSAYMVQVMPWHMPLLFLIAGYSAAVSLSQRSLYVYSVERLQRLLVPLLFFMLTIGALAYYISPGNISSRSVSDLLFDYYPYYLKTLFISEQGIRPRWAHLWFVGYLLIFNLVAVPILLKIGQQGLKTFTSFLRNNVAWFPIIIFSSIVATLGARWPLFIYDLRNVFDDWAYVAENLFAFTIGYLIFFDDGILTSINRRLRIWTILCVGSSVMQLVFAIKYQLSFYDASNMGRHLLYSVVIGVNTWSTICLVLSLFHRYLVNTNNSLLRYMKKVSFPFYILHLPIILALGLYTKPLELGVLPEFLLLAIGTTLITTLVYELLIKPFNISQVLFGVKSNARASARDS